MNRDAMSKLIEWKNSSNRKPLIIKGARQVGKTWLMHKFGEEYYKNYFYFNFDEEVELKSIFEKNKDVHRIIELLGMIKGKKINSQTDLIIFDEIQECPQALNSMKYFCENANEYHVISAGSLLGTLLAKPKSYPVGKVNFLNIYPLSFSEFLQATDENLYQYYLSINLKQCVEEIFHNKLLDLYNIYLCVGGMPECVYSWINEKNPSIVSQIQSELVELYENDFSKHNGSVNSGRILMVFRSIVTQLAKDNEKFIYGCIKEGARAREFEEAIEWLVSSGIVIRTYNVSKPYHPIKVFERLNHFKLFIFDIGLLKHMAGISNEAILLDTAFQFKGAFTENYVLQQLRNLYDIEPHYYAPKSTSEIDFIVQDGMDIIPIEVKAGKNVSAQSFKDYIKKNNPTHAVKISKLGLCESELCTNIPLYLVNRMREII